LAEISGVTHELRGLVEKTVAQQATLIPRQSVYLEMASSLRAAKSEVIVITYLMYDWDRAERTFEPLHNPPPGVDEFYAAIYDSIRSQSLSYVRVWQVATGHTADAEAVLRANAHLAKECDLINEVGEQHPELARLVITEQLTTASFILVDRTTLFFNIDFYDPSQNVWLSPYMLLVKDTSGTSFRDLQSVVVRLTGKRSEPTKQPGSRALETASPSA
jgi:hypothetical protein